MKDKFLILGAVLSVSGACSTVSTSTAPALQDEAAYSAEDFSSVRKFDAHTHINTADKAFMEVARNNGFELLSVNVDYPDFPSLPDQATAAAALKKAAPQTFHFTTTFPMTGFEEAGWTARTAAHIDRETAKGAIGVKVWKNIGMVERNQAGDLIFLDDPGFDGIVDHIKNKGLPLIAHQGEPKNCWLPLDEMTTENDRLYFAAHPEYHMYKQPHMPRYEELITKRDTFVAAHPKLSVVGAHLGSLEWSIERLGEHLDTYPNATVDMAARMSQLQYQSNGDREAVRAFFIRYQDRILYGSDLTQNPPSDDQRAQNPPIDNSKQFADIAVSVWKSDWLYLATDETQYVSALKADARGLELPKSVIRKIYYDNARRVFFGE